MLFKLGKYEEAVKSFDRAIEIKAQNETAWNRKGESLVALGKFEEALSAFDRAIEQRLRTMKAIGCNGIRLAHNPHTPALLDPVARNPR